MDAIKQDWAEAPRYSYIERDVESKKDAPAMSKTYRVLMIEGSPYNMVTSSNDQPLSSEEKAIEQRKLQREMERRHNESERARRRRVAKYEKEREHDHAMLQQMADAFDFHVTGEAQVDGHRCWILDAEPKPGYQAQNHEGRVLKVMKGKLWVDQASYQWVKVHAEVMKPVNFYGFLAKVGPGTEFDLEQEPVANGIWMPKLFHVRVQASALGFLSENSNENDTYRDYQPMPQALALLQSSK
ncbi:MAG TPA: hypothetical protein VFW44_08425 [Bryobacteraceae bacterium]|nr:hypothetical protein [Bryobacteraceae bacterium]